MKVESHQFSLQVVYEGVAIEKIPNDAVRERLTVQLQISCKLTVKYWELHLQLLHQHHSSHVNMIEITKGGIKPYFKAHLYVKDKLYF